MDGIKQKKKKKCSQEIIWKKGSRQTRSPLPSEILEELWTEVWQIRWQMRFRGLCSPPTQPKMKPIRQQTPFKHTEVRQFPFRTQVSQDTAVSLPFSPCLNGVVLPTFILSLFHNCTWRGKRWQIDNNPFMYSRQTQWGDCRISNCMRTMSQTQWLVTERSFVLPALRGSNWVLQGRREDWIKQTHPANPPQLMFSWEDIHGLIYTS